VQNEKNQLIFPVFLAPGVKLGHFPEAGSPLSALEKSHDME
jgi:hypothetical protein